MVCGGYELWLKLGLRVSPSMVRRYILSFRDRRSPSKARRVITTLDHVCPQAWQDNGDRRFLHGGLHHEYHRENKATWQYRYNFCGPQPRTTFLLDVLQKNWISDIFTAMKTHVSATQAARTFADLVNRVYYRGEIFVIEQDGTPLCQLVPIHPPRCTVAELVQLMRRLPAPDEAYWQTLEALTQQQPALPPSPWSC